MAATIISKRGLDGRDAEAMEALQLGRGWQLVEQRLKHELGVQLADLERPHSEIETAAIRGSIKMLRLALAMPEGLRREAAKGKPVNE